jgi:hypothetical protein
MSEATRTMKRMRFEIHTALDLETIRGAVSEVDISKLGADLTYGLLMHEVRVGKGRTEIVASTSAAGAKIAAERLRAISRGTRVAVKPVGSPKRR